MRVMRPRIARTEDPGKRTRAEAREETREETRREGGVGVKGLVDHG